MSKEYSNGKPNLLDVIIVMNAAGFMPEQRARRICQVLLGLICITHKAPLVVHLTGDPVLVVVAAADVEVAVVLLGQLCTKPGVGTEDIFPTHLKDFPLLRRVAHVFAIELGFQRNALAGH